jgi:ATP-dependent 26S proteasome regulatory subunit
MLKTQFMTMTMMKGANQPNQENNMYTMLYSMLMISIIEWIFKQIPIISASVTEYAKPLMTQWIATKQKTLTSTLLTPKEQQTLSTITLCRVYKDGSVSSGSSSSSKNHTSDDNPVVERVDAVLDHMCTLDNAHHIRMDTRTSLNTTDDIDLTPFLKAKIKQTLGASETVIEVVLTSSILKVSEIRQWIDDIHAAYVAEKNNKLGNRIYYFDELPAEPQMQVDVSNRDLPPRTYYKWESMPRALTFTMNEFNTSKSFSNVYGHHVDDLKERLDLFLNHPEWYRERGIPHTLGILLSGVPGAGKTSTFKAIIKDSRRHPIVIKLRPYTTQQQLKNLFYNETIVVQNADGQKQTFKIPLNKRFYIIEDIGCMTDVVLDREKFPLRTQPEGDAITLDFLLNLIDGVLETPGRLLGLSDNYPENLDRALVRPGRVDVRIHFSYVDIGYLRDMFMRFFELTAQQTPVMDAELLSDLFTPAEVMECMCNHYKNPAMALAQLSQKARERRGLTEAKEETNETPEEDKKTPEEDKKTPVSAEDDKETTETTETTEASEPYSIPMSSAENIVECVVCERFYDSQDEEETKIHTVNPFTNLSVCSTLNEESTGRTMGPKTRVKYGTREWMCLFEHTALPCVCSYQCIYKDKASSLKLCCNPLELESCGYCNLMKKQVDEVMTKLKSGEPLTEEMRIPPVKIEERELPTLSKEKPQPDYSIEELKKHKTTEAPDYHMKYEFCKDCNNWYPKEYAGEHAINPNSTLTNEQWRSIVKQQANDNKDSLLFGSPDSFSREKLCKTVPPIHIVTSYPRSHNGHTWTCPNIHESETDSVCGYCTDEVVLATREKLNDTWAKLQEPHIRYKQLMRMEPSVGDPQVRVMADNVVMSGTSAVSDKKQIEYASMSEASAVSDKKRMYGARRTITDSPPPLIKAKPAKPHTSSLFDTSGLGAFDTDGFASLEFKDDVPPPGAPPFNISMFTGSQRVSYDLNPAR